MSDTPHALKHILVINDWGWMLSLLSQLLALEGFLVSGRLRHTLSDGEIARLGPDVIVLDIPPAQDEDLDRLLHELATDPGVVSISLVVTCTTVPCGIEEMDERPTLYGRPITIVQEPYSVTTLVEAITRCVER